MPQISKHQLSTEVRDEIIENLWLSLVTLSKKEEASSFIDDLLTNTEKVMLAKRLAIAVLLLRNWKYDDIKNFLKVSSGTINSVNRKIHEGAKGFLSTIQQLEKKKSLSKMIQKSEKSLGIMPPIVGRGRWRWLYQK